jgi:S1-C subfamily serine protease
MQKQRMSTPLAILAVLVLLIGGLAVYEAVSIHHLQKRLDSVLLGNAAVDVSSRQVENSTILPQNGPNVMAESRAVNDAGDYSQLIAGVLPSVVSVRTDIGIGSGAIVDKQGYVLTNYHVIQDATDGKIRTYDNQSYEFSIIATNKEEDLALLKIDAPGKQFTPLRFESDDNIKAGMRVFALGSPAGLDFTVTSGIVSAIRTELTDGERFVQIDVPINPGNSGGPLIDVAGRIVGINTLKYRSYEGIGFAIESDVVSNFVSQAIAQDKAGES